MTKNSDVRPLIVRSEFNPEEKTYDKKTPKTSKRNTTKPSKGY